MGSAGANVPAGNGSDPPAAPSLAPELLRRWLGLELQRTGPSWERRVRQRPAGGSADVQDRRRQGGEEQQRRVELTLPAPLVELHLFGPAPAPAWPVAFGSVAMQGRMPHMEDAVSLRPGFHTWTDGSPMHFFAVFDGHGGSFVSALCRDRMHEFLAEELVREGASFLVRREHATAGVGTTSAAGGAAAWVEQAEEERAWRAALGRAFRRIDTLAVLPCGCGRVTRPRCRCALSINTGFVGSTAVVALLVRGLLVVANCGDSRAVLCRGPAGTPAVPLSDDHKPTRPEELARIQAMGAQVVLNNSNTPRVRGVLAMSRALGDWLLKPEVISEPEITITERTADDQCLILASDGMWDVISNETACHVARQCVEYRNPPPPAGPSAAAAVGHDVEPRCSSAAMVLARPAIARRSADNISVVVVDLKQRCDVL